MAPRKKKPTRRKAKPVTRKKTAARRKKKPTRGKKKQGSGFSWFKWAFGLFLLGSLLLGGYSLYLSKVVRVKFEGKRWAVPARVYARPLDLYVGAPIKPEQLQAELSALGYRKVSHPTAAAQWSRAKSRFLFRTRAFQFWDGSEPAHFVDLRFDGNGVSRMSDGASGASIDLLRLEPPEIGSIYPSHNEDRVLVKREDLPDHLVQALLASEDRKFFSHHGVDPGGILRAVAVNLRAGKSVQGASTLTQQLVKNFYLTPERTLTRKLNEALMALLLDARYGKDEILEAYANEVFLGQDGARAIHGFGLASYFYFNRPLSELQVHETALLVGLLKGASYYNPRQHPQRALDRRNLVLDLMARQGFISPAEADKARQRPLGVTKKGRVNSASHPAFIDLVRRQLRRDYREEDLTSEGLRIFTTLDPWLQSTAEERLAKGLAQLEKNRGLVGKVLEGAAVVISPEGGEVRALVGGRESRFAGFNRALDAVRPVGSLIKPFVYLAALAQPGSYTLVTQLEDTRLTVRTRDGQEWSPGNYDKQEHGLVQLHTALAQSYNLATVRLGMALGVNRVVDVLKSFGIQRPVKPFPSLFLGATSLTPLEVAQMYQVLAADGFRTPLRAIREITDSSGQPLQRYPLEVERVAEPSAVYLLKRNLVEVTRSGTGKGVYRYLPEGLEVAGKTGTTNDLRDSWFAGFSSDLLAVVWVGRDDNKPAGLTGASGALRIWGQLMKRLDPMPLSLIPPDDVAYHWVERQTGFLSAEHCPDVMAMPFIKGSEPSVLAECHGSRGIGGFLNDLFD